MDSRNRPNSKLKRQHKSGENKQRKSQRLASPAESEPERTTKITDLNDDCLVKIFGYLDLRSLFYVAIANAFLRPAARDVYKRKFGGKQVAIGGCDDPNTRAIARMHDVGFKFSTLTENKWCSQSIKISGLKLCLLYLRCFGPVIIELLINYNDSMSKRYGYVHQYINNYCADSLISIKFLNMPNIAIEQFQKVFVRIKNVAIFKTDLGEQWPSLVECFPNLRRLEICNANIEHSVVIKKPFEYLEHLQIGDCNTRTTNQLATTLLRGIRQLKTLQIMGVYVDGTEAPIGELMDMIKANPSITKFMYWYTIIGCISVNTVDVQRIVTEHAALAELWLRDFLFTAADAITLTRQLNSLTEFQIQLENSQRDDLVLQLNGEWETKYQRGIDDNHTMVKLKRKV